MYEQLIKILCEATVYCPADGEAMRINHIDDENPVFYCYGEETGNEYEVSFDEVDLDTAMFYKLVLIDNKA